MDNIDFNLENNSRRDLAVGQYAQPKSRQPLDLQAVPTGMMFEIENDEDDWDLVEDSRDENYEDDTYELFQSFTPADSKMKFSNENTAGKRNSHCVTTSAAEIIFDEIEQQMKDVNDGGTVKKMIIKAGNGQKIPSNCRVYFHYSAIAEGCDESFDTTLVRKYPQSADLRVSGTLLPGLEEAVRSMELREAARFIVHPSMAFGELGCPPRVPPNTRILFIVETLQLIDEVRLNSPLYMSTEERNSLPFRDIYKLANTLRTEGNGQYTNGNLQFGIKKWRRGIQILEEYPAADEVICRQRSEMLHTMYANMAQAYLKLEKPAQACNACKAGLRLANGSHACKLYYRFAKAKLMLKDCDAAMSLVEKGLTVDRKNSDLLKLAKEIRAEDKTQTSSHKKMWSKLFKSKPKGQTAGTSKPDTPGSSKGSTPGPFSNLRPLRVVTPGPLKPLKNGDERMSVGKASSPKVKQSGSVVTLVGKEDITEQHHGVEDFLQKLESMKFEEETIEPLSDTNDIVPPYSSCSEEVRRSIVPQEKALSLLPEVCFDNFEDGLQNDAEVTNSKLKKHPEKPRKD